MRRVYWVAATTEDDKRRRSSAFIFESRCASVCFRPAEESRLLFRDRSHEKVCTVIPRFIFFLRSSRRTDVLINDLFFQPNRVS